MKISYLVTCSTETDTLRQLLEVIGTIVKNTDDEIVVLIDSDSKNNAPTESILKEFVIAMQYELISKKTCKILMHSLNNDYGSHKNNGVSRCTGDFIFQLDGDELPPFSLVGENLHALIESNPSIEAYAIPRINDFKGATEQDAKTWGWTISESEKTESKKKYAWPDYQWRLFKNDYPRISFKKRLHEKIEGYSKYVALPADEEYALYHNKTIETQIANNVRYNKIFTAEENRGISNPN